MRRALGPHTVLYLHMCMCTSGCVPRSLYDQGLGVEPITVLGVSDPLHADDVRDVLSGHPGRVSPGLSRGRIRAPYTTASRRQHETRRPAPRNGPRPGAALSSLNVAFSSMAPRARAVQRPDLRVRNDFRSSYAYYILTSEIVGDLCENRL